MGLQFLLVFVALITEEEEAMDELVFVGTGVSTGLPVLGHLDGSCPVCTDAASSPSSKNRRNNVSLLIHVGSTNHNILIDCGKTFRDAFLRTLAQRRIRRIDAVAITHDHADAVAGIDDLRDLQAFEEVGDEWRCIYPIPTYLSAITKKVLAQQVKYIVDASDAVVADPAHLLKRRVTCLDFRIVSDTEVEVFYPPGLEERGGMAAIPVLHGGSYRCLGFAFGEQTKVVYISDVSEMTEAALKFLHGLRVIDILVVDCLLPQRQTHFSHFCLDQFWDLVVELKPRRAFGTGMYCDIEHAATNKLLAERLASLGETTIQSVELAYDGLSLRVDL